MEKNSILIVKDEKIPAIDRKDTLISLGYRVTGIASTGERAIEMVEEDTPDLNLMDIHLVNGGMKVYRCGGIELYTQIHNFIEIYPGRQ
jgi:CheY-like chemotaxis protein